jgi:transcription termination factor Rho
LKNENNRLLTNAIAKNIPDTVLIIVVVRDKENEILNVNKSVNDRNTKLPKLKSSLLSVL